MIVSQDLQIHSSKGSGPFCPRTLFAVTQSKTGLILRAWSGAQPSPDEECVISTTEVQRGLFLHQCRKALVDNQEPPSSAPLFSAALTVK